MGIINARPAICKAGTRRITKNLRDHADHMARFQAQGMTRADASKEAHRMVKAGVPTEPSGPKYRVVYGETMPAWEKTFSSMADAKAFAKEHESFGDVIFSITRVVPGEQPRSLMAALAAAQ